MYAVIQIGSLQYKVSEGDVIEISRMNAKEGQDITIDKVLMLARDSDIRIGQPYLNGAKVTAKIVKHFLGDKLIAYKRRRRKDSATKRGYRQKGTAINITKIIV